MASRKGKGRKSRGGANGGRAARGKAAAATGRSRRWIVPILAAVLTVGLAASWYLVREEAAEVAGSPDQIALTWEVPNPDTSRMEPQVARILEEARAAVRSNPSSASAWGRLGQLYDAHELERLAEHCYRHAAALDRGNFRWAYLLAFTRDARHADADEVIALFRRADELVSEYPPAPFRLGDALARRGRYDEAAAAFRRAIELDPDFAMAHRSLGQSFLALGRLDDARRHLERASELMPHDSITRNTLAQVHMRRGNAEAADEAAQQARQRQPVGSVPDPLRYEIDQMGMDHRSLLGRAARRIQEGDYAEAAEELRWAIQAGLQRAQVHAQLATCYERMGDPRRAVNHLRRALDLDPDNERVQQRLAELGG